MSIGSVDYGDLKKLQRQLHDLSGDSITLEAFYESCAKELAARLLAKVIKRTPVGVYPKSSGKKGGTLRRGWTGGKANGNAIAYANSLHVRHEGTTYVIEITNPVKYAPYVEYGHRTANHKGWVEGQFMLTISENELQGQMAGILEKKIANFLKEHLT